LYRRWADTGNVFPKFSPSGYRLLLPYSSQRGRGPFPRGGHVVRLEMIERHRRRHIPVDSQPWRGWPRMNMLAGDGRSHLRPLPCWLPLCGADPEAGRLSRTR
jgi:hypothetical protein